MEEMNIETVEMLAMSENEVLVSDNSKVYNMAVMGAYLQMKPFIKPENIDKGLAKCIPARYADLISLNKAAIEEGMKAVEVLQ